MATFVADWRFMAGFERFVETTLERLLQSPLWPESTAAFGDRTFLFTDTARPPPKTR